MRLFNFAALILGVALTVSCSEGTTNESSKEAPQVEAEKGQASVDDGVSNPNIIQIARGSKDHTTLVAGIDAAGLNDVLANAGPLTVFAPTNAAFDKLPEGVLADLLKPENKATLKSIITYHAAPGNYDADHIKGVMGIGQATGEKVKVEVKDGVTYVNGAKVIASIKASNGYIHVIDGVLLPPSK